jgi:hypothetical protein
LEKKEEEEKEKIVTLCSPTLSLKTMCACIYSYSYFADVSQPASSKQQASKQASNTQYACKSRQQPTNQRTNHSS